MVKSQLHLIDLAGSERVKKVRYTSMYVFMYILYVCMCLCMYVFMYVCVYIVFFG